jgi:uncharacterized protein YndB with AHSA1/START domain
MNTVVKDFPIIVEIDYTFDAPVEQVYGAFVQPKAYARWMCGRSYENIAVDLDVREGGVIHHRIRSEEGESTFFGVYQEIKPNQKLSYTFDWRSDWREEGTPSMVEVSFHSKGDKTELEIRHSLKDERSSKQAKTHWTEFMEVLGEMVKV